MSYCRSQLRLKKKIIIGNPNCNFIFILAQQVCTNARSVFHREKTFDII